MTTDYRALCAELADELERYRPLAEVPDCLQRARAALAEPVGEGPTFDDLSELCSAHGLYVEDWPLEKFEALWEVARAVLTRWGNHLPDTGKMVRPAPVPVAEPVGEGPTDEELLSIAADCFAPVMVHYARAVLARWGRQPAPPAEGEQRHPAPVPVSERLPGPEDCDAEGRCWWGERGIGDMYDPEWTYTTYKEARWFCTFGPHSVWLPAHALPLPAGEMQP